MVIIGILGGVASGKTFVAKQFERLGAQRINADHLGHQVLHYPEVRQALVARWGPRVLDRSGHIDRAQVAAVVFAGPPGGSSELAFLERCTHHHIGELIEKAVDSYRRQQTVSAVVLDAAVLLKAGWDTYCDKIVFVEVSRRLRLERALARGWDEAEFTAREAVQESLDDKRNRADWVIDNGGSPEHTFAQVQQFWQMLDARSSASNSK